MVEVAGHGASGTAKTYQCQKRRNHVEMYWEGLLVDGVATMTTASSCSAETEVS